MSKFFEGIKKGLEDAIEFEKKKKVLKTHLVELPEPPKEYTATDIKKIRKKGPYSQAVFALILNVSPRTVQSWEIGARTPTHSALRLLEIIDKGIYRPKISTKSA
jgi:putative transcriptional regulator